MNADGGARGVQKCGNLCTNASRGAGNQGHAPLQTRYSVHGSMINPARRQSFAGRVIKATF